MGSESYAQRTKRYGGPRGLWAQQLVAGAFSKEAMEILLEEIFDVTNMTFRESIPLRNCCPIILLRSKLILFFPHSILKPTGTQNDNNTILDSTRGETTESPANVKLNLYIFNLLNRGR